MDQGTVKLLDPGVRESNRDGPERGNGIKDSLAIFEIC
jgi:hypothetical protein